jgi:outer membrane protein OmpA-like peptidoglycan-associated protein
MTGKGIGVIVIGSVVALFSACASPPKAPTVNGRSRVPVNEQTMVELQTCRSELSNTQILAAEATSKAAASQKVLSQIAQRCGVPAAAAPPPSPPTGAVLPAAPANTVYVLHFPFGKSTLNLTEESALALANAVRGAQLIQIRGRTDGASDTPSEAYVARERANAVQDYLVAMGVPADRIRSTYQASGDHVSDNSTIAGRALNRRAEVEVYSAPPQVEFLASNTMTRE